MEQESIKYSLIKNIGLTNFEFYFDFFDSGQAQNSVFATGELANWTGCFENRNFIEGKEDYHALVFQATGASESGALTAASQSFSNEGFKLYENNIRIPTNNIDLSNSCFLADFSFTGAIESGILFGSYETEEVQLPDLSYITVNRGYNVGVTDRGHLFVNGASSNGSFVEVFQDIELSKRNVVSFGSQNNNFYISYFDFFKNKPITKVKSFDKKNLKTPSYIHLGGSKKNYQVNDEKTPTFKGNLNFFCGIGKNLGDLYNTYTGFLSDYIFNSGANNFIEYTYLSGFDNVYKTGVTGYSYEEATGVEYKSKNNINLIINSTGTGVVAEGGVYEKLDQNNNSLTKEGYLDESIQNVYNITGTQLIDTLGLTISQTGIDLYESEESLNENTGNYTFLNQIAQTGVLDEILTSTSIYAQTGYYQKEPDSSGINFELNSDDFKKNFLYYKGVR